ncbi:unnamed protein product, partial [Symbiodinium sp. CCMP2456]
MRRLQCVEPSAHTATSRRRRPKGKRPQPVLGCLIQALEHLLPSWKADKTIVLTAIKQSPRAIRHASDSLRSQKDFLIEAISCSKGLALQSLSQDRIQDRELQQAAVSANWMMLGWLRKQAPSL